MLAIPSTWSIWNHTIDNQIQHWNNRFNQRAILAYGRSASKLSQQRFTTKNAHTNNSPLSWPRPLWIPNALTF